MENDRALSIHLKVMNALGRGELIPAFKEEYAQMPDMYQPTEDQLEEMETICRNLGLSYSVDQMIFSSQVMQSVIHSKIRDGTPYGNKDSASEKEGIERYRKLLEKAKIVEPNILDMIDEHKSLVREAREEILGDR